MTVLECNHSLHDQVQAGADHCPLCQAATIEQLREKLERTTSLLTNAVERSEKKSERIAALEGALREIAKGDADSGNRSAAYGECVSIAQKALAEGGG